MPDVDWAYNTGGTVSLAPVFSENGNQIAFIQTSDSVASLVLLTFPPPSLATGTISSPTAETASDYYNSGLGCTAPCSYTVALTGDPNDTWSSPYYDYSTDTLFVGDSNGQLHQFTPVFNGPPAEVTTSPWPVQMAYGTPSTDDTNQSDQSRLRSKFRLRPRWIDTEHYRLRHRRKTLWRDRIQRSYQRLLGPA